MIIVASTIAVVVVTVTGAPEAIRGPITVWFLVTCPGMAIARLLGLGQPLVELMVGLALSLALTGLVASIFLYAGAWSPVWSLAVLVVIAIAGLVVAPVPTTRDRRASMASVVRDQAHQSAGLPVRPAPEAWPAQPTAQAWPAHPEPEHPTPEAWPDHPTPEPRPAPQVVFTLPTTAAHEPDPEPLWVTLAAQRRQAELAARVVAPVVGPVPAAPRKPARRSTAKSVPTAGDTTPAKPAAKPAASTAMPKAAKPPAAKAGAPAAKPAAKAPAAAKPTSTTKPADKPGAGKPSTAAMSKPAASKPPRRSRAAPADGPSTTGPTSTVTPSTPVASPAPEPGRKGRPGPRSDGR